MFKLILNTIPREILIKVSYWVKPLLALWYKGKRYTDPIDGKSYRKFLPYGYSVKRENIMAPGTLSLERHRLLWLYLQRETYFFSKPIKMLHVAPEQAFYKRFRHQKNLDYTTTDISSPLADVKADLINLPFDDATFDVVFCNHVLEHIIDDHKAMQELYRVMKTGGWGIFQIPQDINRATTYEDFTITAPKERTKHFGQYDHVRLYGLDYFDRLASVGFKVNAVNYSAQLSQELIDKYRLTAGELLPVCQK